MKRRARQRTAAPPALGRAALLALLAAAMARAPAAAVPFASEMERKLPDQDGGAGNDQHEYISYAHSPEHMRGGAQNDLLEGYDRGEGEESASRTRRRPLAVRRAEGEVGYGGAEDAAKSLIRSFSPIARRHPADERESASDDRSVAPDGDSSIQQHDVDIGLSKKERQLALIRRGKRRPGKGRGNGKLNYSRTRPSSRSGNKPQGRPQGRVFKKGRRRYGGGWKGDKYDDSGGKWGAGRWHSKSSKTKAAKSWGGWDDCYDTMSPTLSPTQSPNSSSNDEPTLAPTLAPTLSPTLTPTLSPTLSPTLGPTLSPTVSPTLSPSLSPTLSPSISPTLSPVELTPFSRNDEPRNSAAEKKRTGGNTNRMDGVKGAESGNVGAENNIEFEDDDVFIWRDDEAGFEDQDRRLFGWDQHWKYWGANGGGGRGGKSSRNGYRGKSAKAKANKSGKGKPRKRCRPARKRRSWRGGEREWREWN